MHLIPRVLLPLALIASACGGGDQVQAADGADVSTPAAPAVSTSTTPPPQPTLAVAPGEAALSPLASQIVALPSAGGVPEVRTSRVPVGMSFEAIGLSTAPIDPVGVLPNGEMEIPGAKRVGWYSFGASPGEPGSAVLAAHIAFDGERGAFRYLADSTAGDRFSVTFSDGSTSTYEIVERAQYDKDELPFDRVFERTGDPVITLISCGGQFQPTQASYQDNIVAYAVPV